MLTKPFQLILLLLCAAASGFAQDTIVFKNGDTLSGDILEQTGTNLLFKSSSLGTIKLQKSDIAEINPQKAEPPKPAPKPAAPKDQPKKKKQWSGQSGVQIAMRERSNLDQNGDPTSTDEFESYKVYGHVKWAEKKNSLKWSWTYRYSETDGVLKDDFFNITQDYRRTISPRYFATGKSMYQRDVLRKVDKEYLQTAEIGVKWLESNKFKLTTSSGIAYHQYSIVDNGEVDEGTFILDESFRWTVLDSLTLFQKYTHLGDTENYHWLLSSGIENKLIQNLFLKFEYRIDRDTGIRYSSSGSYTGSRRSYYDRALLTSILYKF